MGYSLFQTATLGMMSQAHALNTIGNNIANISTGGFKRTDTRFTTLLSDAINNASGTQSDHALNGVRPTDFSTISSQGLLTTTTRQLDLAISGGGFFQVSPTLALSGNILYTRDGSFQLNTGNAISIPGVGFNDVVPVVFDDADPPNAKNPVPSREAFLTDKNGNFLLGVAPDANGLFSSSTALQTLRVDPAFLSGQFTSTTKSSLAVNLDATTTFGTTPTLVNLSVVDSNGKVRSLTAEFTKTPSVNERLMEITGDDLTQNAQVPGAAFSLATGTGSTILDINPGTNSIAAKKAISPTAPEVGAFLGLKAGDTITLGGSTAGNNGTFTISNISADSSTITVASGTLPGVTENLTTAASLTSTRVVGQRIVFDSNGAFKTPVSNANLINEVKGFTSLGLTWSDGATNNSDLDLSGTTQFAGGFVFLNSSQNGLASANLQEISFDSAGQVNGLFEDGSTRIIYKIPLATFLNPNGMETLNGNVFAETTESGPGRSVFADTSGIALLSPGALELSNVDLVSQFSQMIQVQQAYNSSATVFKTVDEMLMGARDLKR